MTRIEALEALVDEARIVSHNETFRYPRLAEALAALDRAEPETLPDGWVLHKFAEDDQWLVETPFGSRISVDFEDVTPVDLAQALRVVAREAERGKAGAK